MSSKSQEPQQVILLQSIIEMNNIGAKCVERGNYDKASSAFCKALKMAKKLVISSQNNASRSEVEQEMGCWLAQCMRQRKRIATTASWEDDTDYNLDDSCDYIFNRPLFIPDGGHDLSIEKILVSPDCVTAVVMLNLAITYHKKALSRCRNGVILSGFEKNAIKAHSIYKLCHQLLEEESRNKTCSSAALLVNMIVLNNLGQINAMLCANEEAHLCFEQVLSMQMFWMNHCREDDNNVSLTTQVNNFFHNTSRLILSDHSAAAA
jgi:hypothetical protein